MTFGRTRSVALEGLVGTVVDVEAHRSGGLPAFMLGGLPDAACAQSPNRVKAATASIGRSLAQERFTVNLSPASIPKNGSGFDLPIAVAVLAALGLVPAPRVREVVHLGELGLDGTIRAVRGVLPAVLAAARAGCRDVVVPVANAAEARLVPEIAVHAVDHLHDLVTAYGDGGDRLALGVPDTAPRPATPQAPGPDLADVAGQPEARTALELAAAGGHHLFLLGPPGSGKTMLAERLVSILPRLTREQSIDVLAVKSLLGLEAAEVGVEFVPPFIAPHHSATQAAIIGGGSGAVRPGSISQAHHGVLFLNNARLQWCHEERGDASGGHLLPPVAGHGEDRGCRRAAGGGLPSFGARPWLGRGRGCSRQRGFCQQGENPSRMGAGTGAGRGRSRRRHRGMAHGPHHAHHAGPGTAHHARGAQRCCYRYRDR
ncbi:hypothetical protein ASD62_05765 [Phycicoccus sp. Root563]|nr:hypothetical protein ASD62_05765 [Phycicoccus sp. Root563]